MYGCYDYSPNTRPIPCFSPYSTPFFKQSTAFAVIMAKEIRLCWMQCPYNFIPTVPFRVIHGATVPKPVQTNNFIAFCNASLPVRIWPSVQSSMAKTYSYWWPLTLQMGFHHTFQYHGCLFNAHLVPCKSWRKSHWQQVRISAGVKVITHTVLRFCAWRNLNTKNYLSSSRTSFMFTITLQWDVSPAPIYSNGHHFYSQRYLCCKMFNNSKNGYVWSRFHSP